MKIIGRILAGILIFTAIYIWWMTNQFLVPLLLLSSAASILTEKNRDLNRFFTRTGWVLVGLLILKLIFGY